MKPEKIKLSLLITIAIVLGAFTNGLASDNVEWNVYKTMQLDATPIDVALTADGRRIFVLTEKGQVLIYSSTNKMEAKIDVGKHVDQIKLGPRGETLILRSGKNKTVELVTLDFIQKINITGSPFKGPQDAPVVIAVFDDFQ
jgi:DNA-binding beta-propeller fold protein YncE